MELVKAENLSLHNGSKDIISEGSFRLLEGRKYGLIGPNGSGKTTLIRVILGLLEPDKGFVRRKKGLRTGYLPQQPVYDEAQSIEAFLLTELNQLHDRMNEAAARMSEGEAGELDRLMAEYQQACDCFELAGGYAAMDRAEPVLRRLGLDNDLSQTMGSLSGGERSLVFFTAAILPSPELLILDEPGNHLDYLGLAWLETFITGFNGAVLIVSHNRYLLDSTCESIIALERAKLTNVNGNYSDYKLERYRNALVEQSEYESSRRLIEKLEKKIKELQGIAMSQYNPPVSVMAQLGDAKQKLEAEKARGLERPALDSSSVNLDFGDEFSKSNIALQMSGFSLAFGDRILFDNAVLDIGCGEKVALVGPNGSGKTSLVKAILAHGDWNNDGMRIGPSQRIGYLSQTAEFSREAVTIEDEIRSWGALSRDAAFGIASHFSFGYADMKKELSVLSGGEVNRLQLARLMYLRMNFLILDEPTNHMDINTREVIEQAVKSYRGTVLVISHDRYFLDQLVDRVVEIDNKMLVSHEGNFTEYFRAKYPVLPRMSGKIEKRGTDRRKSGPGAATAAEIERRIEEQENEKLALEREMDSAFKNYDRKAGMKAASKIEKLSGRLERLYAEWEEAID